MCFCIDYFICTRLLLRCDLHSSRRKRKRLCGHQKVKRWALPFFLFITKSQFQVHGPTLYALFFYVVVLVLYIFRQILPELPTILIYSCALIQNRVGGFVLVYKKSVKHFYRKTKKICNAIKSCLCLAFLFVNIFMLACQPTIVWVGFVLQVKFDSICSEHLSLSRFPLLLKPNMFWCLLSSLLTAKS